MVFNVKFIKGLRFSFGAFLFVGLISCSKSSENFNSSGKVSGLVEQSSGLKSASLAKGQSNDSGASVTGATVVIAEVQADGSLKTVSAQSVQTDAEGKFVVETNTSGAKDLVVVATKDTAKWEAVVTSEVSGGTTVYAQPLNTESTAEAEVFARLKATGKANVVSQADVQLYVNADVAAKITGNTSAQDQFISSLEAREQANAQAAGNSYFNITSSQMQTVTTASEQAQVSFEAALYNSGGSQSTAQSDFDNYQKAIIDAYASVNVNADTYAKLSAISSKAFINASSGMSSQLGFASAESNYLRAAFILRQAMEAKFQETGASNTQTSAVATAGVDLTNSIQSSVSFNQIVDAFAQYHSAVVAQLKLTLNAQAPAIDAIDASINGVVGAKATLKATVGATVSTDVIVNAYIGYFNAVKTLVQNSMSGISSTQFNASSEILILSNLNL